MKVFLDANILLESSLPGRLKAEQALSFSGKDIVTSPLSAHLYVYFGTKVGIPLRRLTEHLRALRFTPFGQSQVTWAIDNCQGNDFEDALQVACAVTSGCDMFVTLDKKLAAQYGQFIKMKVL